MDAEKDVGQAIEWMMNRCKASVTIESNPHRDLYEPLDEYVQHLAAWDDADQATRNAILDGGILIHVQAYPDTPIGFYSAVGPDLRSAVFAVVESLKS